MLLLYDMFLRFSKYNFSLQLEIHRNPQEAPEPCTVSICQHSVNILSTSVNCGSKRIWLRPAKFLHQNRAACRPRGIATDPKLCKNKQIKIIKQ